MHRTSARPPPLDFLLPHSSTYGIDRRKDIGLANTLPNIRSGYFEPSIRDGLRTPPADEMGTAYQQSQYNNYTGRQDTTFPITGTSDSDYSGTYSGVNVQQRPYNPSLNPTPSTSILRNEVQPLHPPSQASYPQPASPQQPHQINSLAPPESLPRRKSANNDMILPNLQIPSSINDSGGSLAEFAAQITCLFWFEPTSTLHKAEKFSPSSSPVKRLKAEAVPSSGFRKWVVTILSTTQVTQNVILLALLFIYRLKTSNPAVKGRSGSEYRLLTVALMLGNKFLDDNTYTNKTWAEVSGISVTEIHVMEVEFLSNMRYSLLASMEQWKEWQEKLGKFWDYCDAAAKAPLPQPSPRAVSALQPNLPSPPHSVQASPPSMSTLYPPSSASLAHTQSWSRGGYAAPPPVSPLHAIPDLDQLLARKRGYEGDTEEPAAKRISRSAGLPSAPFTSNIPPIRHDAPRLPVPNLTISTSQPYNNNFNGSTSFPQNVPHLPPLSGRAMSTVYPTTPTWIPQIPNLTPIGPPSQHGTHANGSGNITPRRQSPHSTAHDLLSLGSSPVSANFPNHNSPSFYLQQRASPYKPVRHVNTLLFPPPSMHGYLTNTDQMHYQPLGKKHEYRSGVAYPPYQQSWPALPQPNFHA